MFWCALANSIEVVWKENSRDVSLRKVIGLS